MDYGTITKKTSVKFTGIEGDFSYNCAYSYDTLGNITGLGSQILKTADNSYIGTMAIADNGQQNANLISGADMAVHVANFATIVIKIKADVTAAIA
jgi:hypothetical protein